VGQGAVVDGDGLGDLQEADQREPVQALVWTRRSAPRQPRVDGGIGRDQAVDVGEPEEPADPWVVCGVRVEDVDDPLMRKIHYLDKLVDELAKGKSMDRILRASP
jgi:Uncharacterized protein conserved in bacteria (DUF2200)